MNRRNVLRAFSGALALGGVISFSTTSASADPEIISEITLPESGARGLGVNDDEYDLFVTSHESTTLYYVEKDGSVNTSGEGDEVYEGADFSNRAVYVGGYGQDLVKDPFDEDKNTTEREMPADVYSVAVDDREAVLWVGGDNGRIWRLDPVSLDIERSHDFGEAIFGLAYDGTYLWVGDSGRNHISQYDPSTEETVATYGYPNAQSIYDYAFTDGHLWLEGDGLLYETDITKEIPNDVPGVGFSVSQTTATTGSSVSFDASVSEDPDGEIVTYEWDLTGDGNVDATGETVSWSYDSTGDYEVTLTVTDDDGATADTSRMVSVAEPPTARLSISPSNPETGKSVTFSASASDDPDGSIVAYEWDLTGDGDVDATGEEVTRTYRSSGEFWVTLEVTDEDGLSNETRTQITVESAETETETTTEPADTGGGDTTTEPADTGGGDTTTKPADTGGGEADDAGGGTTRPPEDDESTAGGSGGMPGFGIASGVAGVAAVGYVLGHRIGDDEE